MVKIAVLGAGSWGTVLGSMLADNGNEVVLFGNNEKVVREINEQHTNTHYMKNWSINTAAWATSDLSQALDGAAIVLFVLPTQAIRSVAQNVAAVMAKSGQKPLIVTATKGIEPGSKKLISEILEEELYPANP
ncbi:glycerol-3-phosphate dehydrogenase, partial [Lactobacillus sp. XV13L]|nr:glycerol-3-phosphate dehydrogenase [Lactobacillus sp. XV13L]